MTTVSLCAYSKTPERVNLAIFADVMIPTVKTGRISEEKAAPGDFHPSSGQPEAGRIFANPIPLPNRIIRIIPNHKAGNEPTAMLKACIAPAVFRFEDAAAKHPIGTPISNETANDSTISGIVIEAARAAFEATGTPVRTELPKSALRSRASQSPYCCGRLRFSPIDSRRASICSGEEFVPPAICATSPGSRCSAKKIAADKNSRVAAATTSLLITYRVVFKMSLSTRAADKSSY